MKNIEERRNRTIAREANYHASMRAPHIDKTAISPYDDYCDGYGMPGAYGKMCIRDSAHAAEAHGGLEHERGGQAGEVQLEQLVDGARLEEQVGVEPGQRAAHGRLCLLYTSRCV